MTGLALVAFGGSTHTTSAESSAVSEIWECTLALELDVDFHPDQGFCDAVADLVKTWFEAGHSYINNTEYLEYVKVNEYDKVSGHQITDPTLVTNYTGTNGPVDGSNPVSTSVRISLDDGTRNGRHKGGWYPPRLGAPIGSNGMVSEAIAGNMLDNAVILCQGINAVGVCLVAVWSRAGHSTAVATRCRVGRVPDNISRRRNKLHETYLGTTI